METLCFLQLACPCKLHLQTQNERHAQISAVYVAKHGRCLVHRVTNFSIHICRKPATLRGPRQRQRLLQQSRTPQRRQKGGFYTLSKAQPEDVERSPLTDHDAALAADAGNAAAVLLQAKGESSGVPGASPLIGQLCLFGRWCTTLSSVVMLQAGFLIQA